MMAMIDNDDGDDDGGQKRGERIKGGRTQHCEESKDSVNIKTHNRE